MIAYLVLSAIVFVSCQNQSGPTVNRERNKPVIFIEKESENRTFGVFSVNVTKKLEYRHYVMYEEVIFERSNSLSSNLGRQISVSRKFVRIQSNSKDRIEVITRKSGDNITKISLVDITDFTDITADSEGNRLPFDDLFGLDVGIDTEPIFFFRRN